MAAPSGRTLEDWNKHWTDGRTNWHQSAEHKLIMCQFDKVRKEMQKESLKIFFPLCGKAIDMKILADQGHHVVGVDVAPLAAEQFFSENGLQFNTTQNAEVNAAIYQNTAGNMKIYAMDMFDFNSDIEGQFDVIWDRMSLVAINVEDRPRYVNVMKSIMSPDVRYLLQSVEYDNTLYKGPPRVVRHEEIEQIFEDTNINVEKVDSAPLQGKGPAKCEELGIKVYEHLYLLTLPKS